MDKSNYFDKSLKVSKKYLRKAKYEALERLFFYFIPTAQGRVAWLRKKRKFALLGEHVHYQPRKYPTDAALIKIHDNVAIAADVEFSAHDIIHWVFDGMAGKREYVEYRDCIEIYENVFVGAGVRILPGVSIGPNAIIAAGAVVDKDVEPGKIVGGVPARIIGDFYNLKDRRREYSDTHRNKMTANDYWKDFNLKHTEHKYK